MLGIDSSPAMLEIARQRSVGLPPELRLGHVRELAVEALYGGFAREPLDGDSSEFVYVTRRP